MNQERIMDLANELMTRAAEQVRYEEAIKHIKERGGNDLAYEVAQMEHRASVILTGKTFEKLRKEVYEEN